MKFVRPETFQRRDASEYFIQLQMTSWSLMVLNLGMPVEVILPWSTTPVRTAVMICCSDHLPRPVLVRFCGLTLLAGRPARKTPRGNLGTPGW